MEPPEPVEPYHNRHVLSGETVPLKVYFSRILWHGKPRKVPRMCVQAGKNPLDKSIFYIIPKLLAREVQLSLFSSSLLEKTTVKNPGLKHEKLYNT